MDCNLRLIFDELGKIYIIDNFYESCISQLLLLIRNLGNLRENIIATNTLIEKRIRVFVAIKKFI